VESRDLNFVVNACAGELVKGEANRRVTRVCIDSRQVRQGDLFVAIAGENHDAHEFLGEAASRGAVAVLAERKRLPKRLPGCAVIATNDSREALGRLGAGYRRDFSLPTVAVGGSNGKTTTKELLASVLRQKLLTLWSDASFNNDIGVPLTLLRLEKSHQAAVLEVGTNHPGELGPLLKMVQPHFGVLTTIGREHLEYFGDLEGVADEEGWLAELLPPAGKLFINGDNEWTPRILARTRASVVRLGLDDGNDWRARRVQPDPRGVSFEVVAPREEFNGRYRVNLLGRHQAVNALFAIAVGAELGLARGEILLGLAGCEPAKMRLDLWESNGVRVLDDAYNANTDSVLAALQTLLDLPCSGRRVAVLGDMAELGSHAEAAHREIGRRAAEMGVGQLFAVGSHASVTAGAARAAGLNRVLEFSDVEAAAAAVKAFMKPGDVLLVKASRAARLERIAEGLRSADAAKRN
jgi:UDP-N-acetylmuramoyl-tripeptide--D-alanyl-D-alanine ligase